MHSTRFHFVLTASVLLMALLSATPTIAAGNDADDADKGTDPLSADTFTGLVLRGIGPALMSGRIADIAVDPTDKRRWLVAVGSGGVWKTTNAGTTWTPIFDDQGSYSVGCVTLDPANPQVIWVGTGENVSGRHVGYGDGVYRSRDGGATWEHMGLEASEHIGKIVIDPRDSDVVYVAAEGPLWTGGGERGLYKTTDGGDTWTRALHISDHTGITDIELDPEDPETLYAAAYQRRRKVWSLLAGGPESGIWKSTDAGDTWREITTGLPGADMGKIALAVTPADPSLVYATIEASADDRGFYRSTDKGERFTKRNGYVSGGTGPHYYQEIEVSPTDPTRVYQMDVWIRTTADGGATFERLGEDNKHSDNHALWIDPDDPRHLLAGSDGGLYETFDHGTSWRFTGNLPVTQIYKMAVDDAVPFYNVVGGTQDNGTQHGPSRTRTVHGIRNQDWIVPLGADGYACQVDPDNPDVLYAEWQVGNLLRIDLVTGEGLDIKPQPGSDDPPERWNWDAPVLISPHDPARLWFASYRLWRSDDRGNAWTAVSDDLTRGTPRLEMPVRGRVQSVDALYDNGAMSQYATITAISESPLVPGLVYTGSDDGVVAVTEDGGTTWRRIERIDGVPERAFINEVKASLHDADTVFVVLDDHKGGDSAPYLLRSDDRGQSWRSIAGDLPDRHILWSVVQDHVEKDLLFVGTELGIFFTRDGGDRWIELAGGVPTIAFRDLEIQRRESDLVGATFGRGFYILDDYSPLRSVSAETLAQEATLFPVRDAWWYVPSMPLATPGKAYQGSSFYTAANPPFGAVFTVYLRDAAETPRDSRRAQEKELGDDADVPFPGWETLAEEDAADEAWLLLTVQDAEGGIVRRLRAPAQAGFQRIAWDLRRPAVDPVSLDQPGWLPPWASPPRGPLVAPGDYAVTLARVENGSVQPLGETRPFAVVPLPGTAEPLPDFAAIEVFQRQTADLLRRALGASRDIDKLREQLAYLEPAILAAPAADTALLASLEAVERAIDALAIRLDGDWVRGRLSEPSVPSILGRIFQVSGGHWDTRLGPTATHRQNLERANEAFTAVPPALARITTEVDAIRQRLESAGAPWTPGG